MIRVLGHFNCTYGFQCDPLSVNRQCAQMYEVVIGERARHSLGVLNANLYIYMEIRMSPLLVARVPHKRWSEATAIFYIGGMGELSIYQLDTVGTLIKEVYGIVAV